MNEGFNKKFIRWLIDEDAIIQEENVVHAEKAFFAHSFIRWWESNGTKKKMNDEELKSCMLILRLFLKGKLDLYWDGGIIKRQEIYLNEQGGKDGSSCMASDDE